MSQGKGWEPIKCARCPKTVGHQRRRAGVQVAHAVPPGHVCRRCALRDSIVDAMRDLRQQRTRPVTDGVNGLDRADQEVLDRLHDAVPEPALGDMDGRVRHSGLQRSYRRLALLIERRRIGDLDEDEQAALAAAWKATDAR